MDFWQGRLTFAFLCLLMIVDLVKLFLGSQKKRVHHSIFFVHMCSPAARQLTSIGFETPRAVLLTRCELPLFPSQNVSFRRNLGMQPRVGGCGEGCLLKLLRTKPYTFHHIIGSPSLPPEAATSPGTSALNSSGIAWGSPTLRSRRAHSPLTGPLTCLCFLNRRTCAGCWWSPRRPSPGRGGYTLVSRSLSGSWRAALWGVAAALPYPATFRRTDLEC